jgi:hypothetical protein
MIHQFHGNKTVHGSLIISSFKSLLFKFSILMAMLLGLPILGITLAGHPLSRYLEFPPQTLYVLPAPFFWMAFWGYSFFILAVCLPLTINTLKWIKFRKHELSPSSVLPWWGWLGAAGGAGFWILAWSRFSWFSAFQPHTFTPLWISYILVVNALKYQRSGQCMITSTPVYFLLLFPLSAVFWWFFEYLNRFVQNWYYQSPQFSAVEYFWYATLSFSTVLPAVLGTRELILQTGWLQSGYKHFLVLRWSRPKLLALVTLIFSIVGLAGIGVWPNHLFALLWISPLLIIVSLQELMNEPHVLTGVARGDWRLVISSALAALICGFFWEMWNYYSYARWVYRIPFVHRFQIFEMPLLGYAGYLPFGLQCTVVGGMFERLGKSWQKNQTMPTPAKS